MSQIPNKNEYIKNEENNLRNVYSNRINELTEKIVKRLPHAEIDISLLYPQVVVDLVKEDFRCAGWYVYQYRKGFLIKKDILIVSSERPEIDWY